MEEQKRTRDDATPRVSRFRFGPYELDLRSSELCKNNLKIRLQEQPFLILVALLERPGEVVLREEIRNKLWPDDTVVEFDHGINAAVKRLRDALSESADKPRYIETLARKGYRFIGKVEFDSTQPTESLVNQEETIAKFGTGQSLDIAISPGTLEPPRIGNTAASDVNPALAVTSASAAGRFRRPVLVSALAFGVFSASSFLWHTLNTHHVPADAIKHLAGEQRITSHPSEVPIESAAVSPDGKYVAYADPSGLYLCDIASGEIRPWAVPKNFVALPDSWFPDGTHLLVTRIEGESRIQSLWQLSLLGGTPRMLKEDATAGAISPDGSRIAYLPVHGARTLSNPDLFKNQLAEFGKELWLMDADGSHPHEFSKVDVSSEGVLNQIGSFVWSPSGLRIAYIERHGLALSDPNQDSFALLTRDVNGNDPHIVVSDRGLKPALCWFPDGRLLYAVREELGSERDDDGVRSIKVDERTGRAIDRTQVVTHGQGRIGGLSAALNAKRLILWRSNTQPQAYIVEFQVGSRKLKSPRRLTLDANGNLASAWTLDSKKVIFASNRHGMWKLFKQAIDDRVAEVLVQGQSLFLPRLSPDGSQVLYLAYPRPADSSNPVAIMRVPLSGGAPQTILQAPHIVNFQCASAPSRLCILSTQVGGGHIFFSFDMEQGLGREILRVETVTNWSLSPDGSKLAIFLEDHRLQVRSLDSGKCHDVSVRGWPLDNGDWSADSKSLFMQSVALNGKPVILEVDQSGKAKVVLEGAPDTSFVWLVPSPNGRYGILEAEVPGDNNIWMIDNF